MCFSGRISRTRTGRHNVHAGTSGTVQGSRLYGYISLRFPILDCILNCTCGYIFSPFLKKDEFSALEEYQTVYFYTGKGTKTQKLLQACPAKFGRDIRGQPPVSSVGTYIFI